MLFERNSCQHISSSYFVRLFFFSAFFLLSYYFLSNKSKTCLLIARDSIFLILSFYHLNTILLHSTISTFWDIQGHYFHKTCKRTTCKLLKWVFLLKIFSRGKLFKKLRKSHKYKDLLISFRKLIKMYFLAL